jgi:hypothetical protein
MATSNRQAIFDQFEFRQRYASARWIARVTDGSPDG